MSGPFNSSFYFCHPEILHAWLGFWIVTYLLLQLNSNKCSAVSNLANVTTRNKCFAAAGQRKQVKLRDGHVLLSLIMQSNLWLGLHIALWVIRDHVVCLAC